MTAIQTKLNPRSPEFKAGREAMSTLVSDLRDLGLELPCDRVPCLDRDGFEVRRGVYNLTQRDRIRIARWLARRAREGAQ